MAVMMRTIAIACVLLGGCSPACRRHAAADVAGDASAYRTGDRPQVEVFCRTGLPLLHSPRQGLWSVAMDWQDHWPAQWYHGGPDERRTSWRVDDPARPGEDSAGRLEDVRQLPPGKRDHQVHSTVCVDRRETGGTLYTGDPVHGSRRVVSVLMPGVLYHGNPSGAKSGRVPVYTGQVGEEALFEEHRFPMPFVSGEWQDQGPRFWRRAARAPLPRPIRSSLVTSGGRSGCVAQEDGTELTLLSGPCASNGVRSSIKQRQGGFEPYDETYLVSTSGRDHREDVLPAGLSGGT